jgi:predicted Zn-dependent peptidase
MRTPRAERERAPRAWLVYLLSAACLLAGPPGPEAAGLDPGQVSFAVAPSGLRLIVKEDHFAPVVAIDLVVRAGSADESAGLEGASHFLEHLAFKGSENHPPGEMALQIDGMGGSLNAATLRDFTHYYVTVPAAHFSAALRLLVEAVLRPTFPRAAVEQERLIISNEQQRLHDQPLQWVWDLSYQAAFKLHPYGRALSGPSPSPLSREDLLRHHRQWYLPNNLSVIIVGDVSLRRAAAEVKEAFAGVVPRPLPRRRRPAEPPLSGVREIQRRIPWKQAYVMLSFHSPGMSDPREVVAADLALSLLGEGHSCRLRRELRERRQLALEVGTEYLTTRDPGLFSLWAFCEPGKVKEVRAALLEEVRRLREEPIPAAELAKAKRLLAASYTLSNETYTDQATTLGYYEGVGSYSFATQYLSLLETLSGADVRAFALRCLDPGSYVWCAAGPFEEQK